MSLEDVIDKIRIGNLSNQGSPGFEQRTDELLGNLYALGGEIQAMLDAMVSDPRNFQVEFLNDGTEAGEGEDSYTGDWTYAARIDYN